MKLIQQRKKYLRIQRRNPYISTYSQQSLENLRLKPDQLCRPSYSKDCRTTLLPLLSSRLLCCEYRKGYSMALGDKPENMHYMYLL